MNKLIVIIILILVFLAAGYLGYTGLLTGKAGNGGSGDAEGLAKCLTDKGVVMYGSKYCPHCRNQKEMFGDAFQYVNYIECTEERQKCMDAGITGVPAWIIDGNKYEGVQPLEKLAELAGCEF
jgi:protein-disulfide isomerase